MIKVESLESSNYQIKEQNADLADLLEDLKEQIDLNEDERDTKLEASIQGVTVAIVEVLQQQKENLFLAFAKKLAC